MAILTETLSDARAQAGYALGSQDGEAFWLLGMLQTIKIGRADTNGQYGMIEIVVPQGLGSPWHVHPEEDEWFYVLDGRITFYVGDTRLDLGPGGFAFGPKRAPHVYRGRADLARAGGIPADAVRGLPAGGRPAGARACVAAAARRSAGLRAARRRREAERVHRPRPSGTAARALGSGQTKDRPEAGTRTRAIVSARRVLRPV